MINKDLLVPGEDKVHKLRDSFFDGYRYRLTDKMRWLEPRQCLLEGCLEQCVSCKKVFRITDIHEELGKEPKYYLQMGVPNFNYAGNTCYLSQGFEKIYRLDDVLYLCSKLNKMLISYVNELLSHDKLLKVLK